MCLSTPATEPPDSEVNPQTGNIESAQGFDNSGNDDVRHIEDPGGGEPQTVTVLSTDSDDDLAPRITITDNGDSWVVWWRDESIDGVFLKHYDHSESEWSSEIRVSESSESSSDPAIANDGVAAWVAYAFESGSSTVVAVCGTNDPVPWPTRTTLRSTSYTGDVDVEIHYESSHLWVTWVDSAGDVGWSEYDSSTETWSSPDYESYSGSTVADARDEIRATVLS